MKLTLITALLGFGMSATGLAAEAFRVYAPSSKTKTLWIVDAVPRKDGGLELKVAEKRDLGFPGRVIAAHPEKPLLYVSASDGERGKVPGAVVTLARNGSYATHQSVDLNDGASYLSLDRIQAFLFGISYGNGRLNVYRLDENGVPGKAVATVDEGKKEAHCVMVTPDNNYLYIPYVKGNLALLQYRFDASSGAVTPLDPLNANPPPGTGPRHLVYHPTLPMVYFTNEQGIGLSTYERLSDGQLALRQDIAILPEGMSKEGLSASDLEVTPDGKFIFAGLRGHSQDFDRIARYRVREDGQAELLGLTPMDKIPWGLALSPDGKYLLVSATTGATLSAYRITTEGSLEKAASLSWDAEISDLLTLKTLHAAAPDLSKITSRADLDAAERHPHVEAVIRTVEAAKGKVEKTEDGQSLKLVDLAVPGAGPHDHRKDDPYDAAFFEHLSHISTLESLNIIATKANDEWIAPLGKLTNLKTLRFTNNGKLTDAGMEAFAGLTNLETFSFVGTGITGKAYAKCTGWTKVTKVSHRGSSINDEGLKELCEHLPNLESISLAHAKFTDVGAPHLAKLTKLKGFEIGTSKATPQALVHLAKLPLGYLQLGEGFDSIECIPLIKGIATLRRLTLTNAAALTDADLKVVASLAQLEHLELGKIDLPDERLPVLKDFAFLKSMRLVPVKEPFSDEVQAKIKALLPKTELQFK